MGPETLESLQKEALAEVLESYPEKIKKSRAKHLGVDSPEGTKGACDSTRRSPLHKGTKSDMRFKSSLI